MMLPPKPNSAAPQIAGNAHKAAGKPKATIRALLILREDEKNPTSERMRPREFAQLMWPDSPGWNRMHRCGYGVSAGARMPVVGGQFLGKLRARGLIGMWNELTPKGRKMLESAGESPK